MTGFRKKKGEEVSISARLQPQVFRDIYDVDYKFYIDNSEKFWGYTMRFSADDKGHVTEKRLYRKNEIIWKEKIERSGETVKGYSRYVYVNGQEKLLFTAENSFFSTADLPAPVAAN